MNKTVESKQEQKKNVSIHATIPLKVKVTKNTSQPKQFNKTLNATISDKANTTKHVLVSSKVNMTSNTSKPLKVISQNDISKKVNSSV